jgi:hypothetical protein
MSEKVKLGEALLVADHIVLGVFQTEYSFDSQADKDHQHRLEMPDPEDPFVYIDAEQLIEVDDAGLCEIKDKAGLTWPLRLRKGTPLSNEELTAAVKRMFPG